MQDGEISRYEDLADGKYKGRICIRSSSNIYNQSLLGSMIEAHGQAAAEDWAQAVTANFARDPKGGDTDQLRALAAGVCDVAVANSYYFVRLMTKPKAKDKGVAEKVGWVFPNQGDRGTHVNVSGAGVLKNAPNKDAAIKFLEYLVSEAGPTLLRRRQQRVSGGERRGRKHGVAEARRLQGRSGQCLGARQEPARSAENLRSGRLEVTFQSGESGRRGALRAPRAFCFFRLPPKLVIPAKKEVGVTAKSLRKSKGAV